MQAAVRELMDGRVDQRVPALGGRDALTRLLLVGWRGLPSVAILRDAQAAGWATV